MIVLKRLFSVLIVLCLITTSAFAHPGRTDSAGGHKDNKNVSGLGPYHYHHGYPAHLHTDGICPYETPVSPAPEAAQAPKAAQAPEAAQAPAPAAGAAPSAPAAQTEREKAEFLDAYIAIIVDGGKEYHTLDCPVYAEGEDFIAYNVSKAQKLDYTPCAKCHPAAAAKTDREKAEFLDAYIAIIVDGGKEYHTLDCPVYAAGENFCAYNVSKAQSLEYTPCAKCHPAN